MSHGRRGRLPGQSHDPDRDRPDRQPPDRDPSSMGGGSRGNSGGGRRIPKASGGGGVMMLIVMAAIAFIMFRGMGDGIIQREGEPQQRQPAERDDAWRIEQDKHPRINVPGMDDQAASDEVTTRDGWSMKDADADHAGDSKRFDFSDQQQQATESDTVEKDGWSMKDSDNSGGKRDRRRDQR